MRRNVLVGATASENDTPDLISRLLGFVEDVHVQALVRVEAWNTLRAIAQFHFQVARAAWIRIDAALRNDQNLDDIRVRSAGMQFLDEYSKAGANASDPLVRSHLLRSVKSFIHF